MSDLTITPQTVVTEAKNAGSITVVESAAASTGNIGCGVMIPGAHTRGNSLVTVTSGGTPAESGPGPECPTLTPDGAARKPQEGA